MWFIMIDSVRYKDLWFTKLIDAPRLALIPLQKKAIAENKSLWLWSRSNPFEKEYICVVPKVSYRKMLQGVLWSLDTFRIKCYQHFTVLPTNVPKFWKVIIFWSIKHLSKQNFPVPTLCFINFGTLFRVTFGHKIAKVGTSGAKR